jgi:hypothetical protein
VSAHAYRSLGKKTGMSSGAGRLHWSDRKYGVKMARLLGVLLLLCSCNSVEPSCEVRWIRQALTNAIANAEYVMLEPSEEAAVAAIQLDSDAMSMKEHCSGVLVGERLALTAKHCASGENPENMRVLFGQSTAEPEFETAGRLVAAHPDLNIMALELAQSPRAAMDVVPIPPAPALPSGFAEGSLAQLAGFGHDEKGSSGRLGFLVEAVMEITDDAIEVGAQGLGGACSGDSGGPLIARGDDGRAYVLGVLESGSAGCFGQDLYTRIDTLNDWLVQRIDASDGGTEIGDLPDAETLGERGRCFDGKAVWFDGGKLYAEVCKKDGICGWSEKAEGYRCLAEEDDPCVGVTEQGACEDGMAVRCVRGRVESNPCEMCGFDCARSPGSGIAVCRSVGDGDAGGESP